MTDVAVVSSSTLLTYRYVHPRLCSHKGAQTISFTSMGVTTLAVAGALAVHSGVAEAPLLRLPFSVPTTVRTDNDSLIGQSTTTGINMKSSWAAFARNGTFDSWYNSR